MGLVWTASLVVFVLVYFFIFAPQVKIKSQLVNEANEKKQIYEASINAANEDAKKKLADELDALKTRLNDYAVESEDSANLTFDISRIAADKQLSDFTVKTVDPIKETGKLGVKNLQENGIGVSFSSDFRQFAFFLNALERHRPVVFIDRFKVSRQDKNEGSNAVDMSISIFVKKRPEGQV